MNPIRCAVADDEPLALELLESYVLKTPCLELAGSYANGVKALEMLRTAPVDLLFCDIQMPGMNGVEVSRLVPGSTRVIFTTAFDQYAVEGFRVNALDYLLKPISYDDFLGAVRKAMAWFDLQQAARSARAPQAAQAEHLPEEPAEADRRIHALVVKSEYTLQQVEFSDILFVEGMKDYVKIHLKEGKPIVSQTSLKFLQTQLPASLFRRVHRSYMVNMDNIRLIERSRIVFGSHYIPISESERDGFMEALSRRAVMDSRK